MPNVSERNRTMQALRESERRYRVVIETASDAIVTIDENDIITYANPAVEKIPGYRPTQLCGQNLAIPCGMTIALWQFRAACAPVGRYRFCHTKARCWVRLRCTTPKCAACTWR
ncbi:MAG TPA: hypothetical protein DEQ40_00295 [Oxalobacteraceae bacterium]|nr:hypothetical protein [Oxalobacteraceae bacterium]